MFVLGTAGHVDHGKSSFLNCLTHQTVDRLVEEKRRGMTIELNFLSWKTDDGVTVGIVDVPGHRRFIRNTVAGHTCIDAFIFLVAADDGWMPQSEEHWQSLRLLGVHDGVVVVSKADLVTLEGLHKLTCELEERIQNTLGRSVPILSFSLHHGITEKIRQALTSLIKRLTLPRQIQQPRLWIDRSFQLKGIGTVVTGTLREGSLRMGDELTLFPNHEKLTIKQLHSYHKQCSWVHPNSRVAIQVSRYRGQLNRGQLLCQGRQLITTAVDARIELLEQKQFSPHDVSFHAGTLRMAALMTAIVDMGSNILVRLKFKTKISLRSSDRFLVRSVGEERLLGGGIVMEPEPTSFRQAKLDLHHWASGAEGWVRYELYRCGYVHLPTSSIRSIYTQEELKDQLSKFDGELIEEEWFVDPCDLKEKMLPTKLMELLQRKNRTLIPATTSEPDDLSKLGHLADDLKLGFIVKIESHNQAELMKRLTNSGQLVKLKYEHFIEKQSFERLKEKVYLFLQTHQQATTSRLKQHLNLPRKMAVMALEKMDQQRLTYLKDGVRQLLGVF